MFSAYYKAYGGETGGIAAQLENELFSCGGARLYADAFLSAEARENGGALRLGRKRGGTEKFSESKIIFQNGAKRRGNTFKIAKNMLQ